MSKKYQKEIELIHDLLVDPAGFDVGVAGVIYVSQDEPDVWTLSVWEGEEDSEPEMKTYTDPMEAAKDFIKLRHDVKLGLDYFQDEEFFNEKAPEPKKTYTLN